MTAPGLLSRDLVDRPTRAKLRGLRGRLRSLLLADAAARLMIAMVAAAAVSLVLDFGIHRLTLKYLDVPQRMLILAGAAAAIAWLVHKYLVRPMRLPMTDEEPNDTTTPRKIDTPLKASELEPGI